MVAKKDKTLYVMPSMFLLLSIIAIIIVIVSLNKNDTSIILKSLIVPIIIFIISLCFLLSNILSSNIRFKIEDDKIYIKNLIVDLNTVDYVTTKTPTLFPSRTNLDIVLKNKERIRITKVSMAYDTMIKINKKYLKLKGNGVK